VYCVIQEVPLKKPDTYGASKEIEVYTFAYAGKEKYCYRYSSERFERDIKKAYKISIHESKRVGGVVTKKQYVVTTVSYYSLAEYSLCDCINTNKLKEIAIKLNTTEDALMELMYIKVQHLEERIRKEFEQTTEYKTHKEHSQIVRRYSAAKDKFAKTYDCDSDEYDYCYDVFGNLRNNTYLNTVIENYKTKRSYYEQSSSNYNWNDFYSNSFGSGSNESYTETERAMLKKFYRSLSKEFHPDNTGDTGEAMQLVNKLKQGWGI
jgi:hypothetical protein